MDGCVAVQVEGETVTLLDYIQIEQPSALLDSEEHEEKDGGEEEDEDDALKPAAFQPLKQSKRLQLKRKAGGVAAEDEEEDEEDEKDCKPKRQRKKYPSDKTCPVCSKAFLRAAAMRRHMETHSANRDLKYKCENCDKRFRDHYDMRRHNMRVHEKDEANNGLKDEEPARASDELAAESKNCGLCGKYFARHMDMERHMKSHSEERPYNCTYCQKKFKNLYVLKRHQKAICKSRELKRAGRKEGPAPQQQQPNPHPSEGPAEGKVCPICSRVLPYSADIAKHLRSHTEERPFVCLACEKGFKYRDTLKKHQIIHGHEGVKEEQSKTVEQILAEAGGDANKPAAATEEKEALCSSSPQPPAESGPRRGPKVCQVCARSFDSVKTLNRHVQCHTEERPYHCVHCKKRFKHVHGLKRHQIYAVCHKKAPRFPWKREGRAGATAVDPPDDQQGVQPKVPVWCSNCGQQFESPSALKQHQEEACEEAATAAAGSESPRCADCGKEFKSVTLLKVHRRIHDPLYCQECGKILANEAAFERHKLMHRPMACGMCGRSFTLLRRLREHYQRQHDFTGPYPCGQCGKRFAQLSYLAVHQRIHQGDFPYGCHLCADKFRSSNCLKVHLRKHTGEKPFLCWQCGKRYRSASELTVHVGTHSEARPWACGQCAAAYRTKLQLSSHVEQVHVGVRYPCRACGKQFMKETSLKRHQLTHTGERPHQCPTCGKTFLTANELRLHNRYHTGERPYKCEQCGKAFIQSGYLKSHMRIHTGEKPFKCDLCDKGFRLSYHMKKHRRTHAVAAAAATATTAAATATAKTYNCKDSDLGFLGKKSLGTHVLTHCVKVEPSFTEEVKLEFQ